MNLLKARRESPAGGLMVTGMKPATKAIPQRRYKKIVLNPGSASEILASLGVSAAEQRKAKAALAAVDRLDALRARRAAQRAAARRREKTPTPAGNPAAARN